MTISQESPREGHADTGEPLLCLKDVVAGYGGGDVLHGVSFDVRAGGSPVSSARMVQGSRRCSRP